MSGRRRHGRGPRNLVTIGLVVALASLGCSDDVDEATAGPDEGAAESTSTGSPSTSAISTTVDTTPTTTAPPLVSGTLDVVAERPAELPNHNVYRPADLDAVGRPLPVVVWGNGGCVRHDATWRLLFERWAAAGFVVATVAAPDEPVDGQPAASDVHSADDQAVGIDWALSQNDLAGGPFEGHIDTGRIVAAGNSCGGITSLALASRDPRVAAVFVLSGSSVAPGSSAEQAAEVMGELTAPVGYVVGGPEDLASPMASQDVEVLPDGGGCDGGGPQQR